MQDPLNIETKARDLNAALEKHLGVRGRSLKHSVRRAGRSLPRRMRKQAKLVAEADALSGNIKLMRQLDTARVERAYTEVTEHLAKIDRAEARRARLVSVLAVLAFNFIVLFVVIVFVLRARGTI